MLSRELESAVQRVFGGDRARWDQDLQRLCAAHPGDADAIRTRAAAIAQERAGREPADGPDKPVREPDNVPARIGPYRILDVLGEGGMGTVYRAEQQQPMRRMVALKLIKLGMDSKAIVNRFEQERQALALMNHEGIAKVFDCGTTERGQPFFVMELVKGIPLDRFCEQQRLSLPARLRLVQQVCAAVQHAHQKGVVHRDLKPGNVLVRDDDGQLQVKIIDFGLAKAMGGKLVEATLFTALGQIVGTPEYMAPEQADPTNQDIDTRADIYSLGVMLYQLLVGELPFPAAELGRAGMLEIQRILREVDPPKPSTRLSSMGPASAELARHRRISPGALRKALKNDLDWVVLKALAKERNRRYDTATALAADLQRYLVHEPLVAGPPSAGYRLQKLLRRYRPQLLAGGAVLATAIAGAVVALEFAFSAAAERAVADEQRGRAQREAAQSRSLAAAAAALEALANLHTDLAVGLALASADMESPPREAGLALARVAYAPWRTRSRLEGHHGAVSSVAATPDGSLALSGSADNSLILWDLRSGKQVGRLAGHAAAVTAVDISADGSTALSGAADGTVILWDLHRLESEAHLTGHSGTVIEVRLSPVNPGQAFSAATDNTLIVWDLPTHTEARRLRETVGDITSLDIAADAAKGLFGTQNGVAAIWDLDTGNILQQFQHGTTVTCVAFIPQSDSLLTASGHGDLQMWFTPTGQSRTLGRGFAHSQKIEGLAVSAHGITALSGGQDDQVILWNMRVGTPIHRFVGHRAPVTGLCYAGDRFVSASRDASLRVWELQSPAEMARLVSVRQVEHHIVAFFSARFMPDGRTIVAGTDLDLVRWDPFQGDRVAKAPGSQREFAATGVMASCIAIDAGGTKVLTGHRPGGAVILWDLATGEKIRQMDHAGSNVQGVAINAAGTRGLSGGWDHDMILWDLDTGRELRRFEHADGVWSVAFHPDGATALSAAEDGRITRWDLESGERVLDLEGHLDAVYSVAISPDGRRAVSGSADRSVILWDLESGSELRRFEGHSGPVRCVAFSPDGQQVVSGSEDMTVRLWDVDRGAESYRFEGHTFPVQTVAFSPDGSHIVSGGLDGDLILWHLPPPLDDLVQWTRDNRYAPPLSPQERARFQVDVDESESR